MISWHPALRRTLQSEWQLTEIFTLKNGFEIKYLNCISPNAGESEAAPAFRLKSKNVPRAESPSLSAFCLRGANKVLPTQILPPTRLRKETNTNVAADHPKGFRFQFSPPGRRKSHWWDDIIQGLRQSSGKFASAWFTCSVRWFWRFKIATQFRLLCGGRPRRPRVMFELA